jgi:Ca2+/Na+ antiporter
LGGSNITIILFALTCIFAVTTMALGVVGLGGSQTPNNFSLACLLITLSSLALFLKVRRKATANK